MPINFTKSNFTKRSTLRPYGRDGYEIELTEQEAYDLIDKIRRRFFGHIHDALKSTSPEIACAQEHTATAAGGTSSPASSPIYPQNLVTVNPSYKGNMTTFVLPTAQEMEVILKDVLPNTSVKIPSMDIGVNPAPYYDTETGSCTYQIDGDVDVPKDRLQMQEIVSAITKGLDFPDERAVGWTEGKNSYLSSLLTKPGVYVFVDVWADHPSVVIRYEQKRKKQDTE